MSRRLGSLASAAALAVAGVWFLAPQAGAEVSDGHCSTATGVTVVVDFQELGGGTVVRCVEDVEAGTTGLQVLRLAGLSPEGTIKEGPSFVCRIAGRPSATETLPVTGTDGYRESCVQAAPDTAFWSYWHADNGGSWAFSNYGASAREVIPGGYEGWSFSLNNTGSSNPAPGVTPAHDVAKPTPSAKPTTPPPPTAQPAPTAKPSTTKATPSPTRSSTAPTTLNPAASSTAAAPPSATPSAPPSASPSASAALGTSSATAAADTPTAEPDAVSPSAPPAAPPVAALPPSGVPTGTLMGAGAVVALGVGGGVVWWRRRGL
ncbi:hypothetical protein [Tessaracoccus sp. G1721]